MKPILFCEAKRKTSILIDACYSFWFLVKHYLECVIIYLKKISLVMCHHYSKLSPAACPGSRWPPATAACLPPTVMARARWLPGCRSQRRWTNVQRVSVISALILAINLTPHRSGSNKKKSQQED